MFQYIKKSVKSCKNVNKTLMHNFIYLVCENCLHVRKEKQLRNHWDSNSHFNQKLSKNI